MSNSPSAADELLVSEVIMFIERAGVTSLDLLTLSPIITVSNTTAFTVADEIATKSWQ